MSRIFPVTLIVLAAWLGARLPITDSGYLDLAQGRQIAETGRRTPPDTILLPASPSETSGWVGSWILFLSHRAGGEHGLRLLGALCLASGALFLYLVQPSGAGFAAAAAAASLAGSTLDISTSLFSWPLVAFMVFCWSVSRSKSKWWLLVPLLPLAAWPFLNRESMVGFVLTGLGLCASLVEGMVRTRRQHGTERRFVALQKPLLFAAMGIAAVTVVMLASPQQSLVGNPLHEAVLFRNMGSEQWQAASLSGDPLYFLLALVTGALAMAAPPLAMPFEALAIAGVLVCSLVSRHFVLFFSALAVPLVCHALAALGTSSRFSTLLRPLGVRWTALAVGVAIVLPTAVTEPKPHPFSQAAHYLSERDLSERLFNLPQSGGVLSWTGGTNRPPFAYLRASSIEAFQREMTGRRLAEIFRDHSLELALLSRDFADQRADELAELPQLRLLYFDEAALVYAQSEFEYPGDLTFNYFDPLLAPSEYADDAVPLAIQELFLYFDHYPPSATALWKLGKLLLRVERREEALEAFEAAHRLDVDDPATLKELSRLYIEKGMYGLAERTTRRALGLTGLTGDEEFVYNLALSLYGQARYSEAAREFEAVLELNGDNLKARRALVDLYQQLGELEQSYQQKQTLDRMVETKTSALLAMARERHEVLDFAAEASLYEQALEISRDDPELLWNLAMVLLTDERSTEATSVLRALLDVAPRNIEAHLTLGVLCIEEPSCAADEAKLHLEAFLELAPDDINAELAEKWLASLE